jgi:hypothetical protein
MANGKMKQSVIKKFTKKKKNGKGSNSLYGIKQGVGKVTKQAFPTAKAPKAKASPHRHVLNAMHPAHLALPRAVGGYTVIRTTDVVNTNRPGVFFGTLKGPGAEFTETTWLSAIGVGSPLINTGFTAPISNSLNSFFFTSSSLSAPAINGSKMVPAAITVQIMNPNALQTTDGIVYIGRSKTVLDLMGDTRSWETVLEELVSYSAPRLCSAGKLALRGVQINAIPNNLSVLSDFVPRRIAIAGTQTWTEATYAADFEGFGPIFIYNPNQVALAYLITIEWRMRFDPLNPAYSGHMVHAPASEATWSKVIAEAESAGNGVLDIADAVADAAVFGAMAAA